MIANSRSTVTVLCGLRDCRQFSENILKKLKGGYPSQVPHHYSDAKMMIL